MKSRIFVLMMVVFCAIALVALALNTVNKISPEQEQASQAVVAPVLGGLLEPDPVQGSSDSFKQPAGDPSPGAAARLAAPVSSRPAQVEQSELDDIPWRHPVKSQPSAGADRSGQTSPMIPTRPLPNYAAAPLPESFGSPAERASALAGAKSLAASPIASPDLKDDEKPFDPPTPEAVETPPPGVSVDMGYDLVYGTLSPGDLVTVTASSGSAFGTARADGAGYFFTPLWGADGRPVDLVGGETIDVYVNGAYLDSVTPLAFDGEVKVDSDQVVGSVDGLSAGSPLTVSLGIWGWEPNTETPQVVATSGSDGAFIATFTADIGPHNFARVEARIGSQRVVYYAYPVDVFNVDSYNYIFGYAQPGQAVTVTVYMSDDITVRGSQTVWANWPHGDYGPEMVVEPGDTIEVDLGGGNLQILEVGALTAQPDLVNDQVTGQAPALTPVRVFIFNWMAGEYAETSTTADASGNYTATFSSYDLTGRDSIFPAYAVGGESEVLLSVFPPRIQAYPDDNAVAGSGDAPYAPFTYTVRHDGQDYTYSGQTDFLNGTGYIDFNSQGVDIAAGDLITLTTPTWSGTMVVADLTLTADTVNDRYLGSTDQPGEVMVVSFPWPAWYNTLFRFASGSAPASPSFTIDLPGHDVRAAVSGRLVHNDANDFATRKNFEVRYIDAELPWGLNIPQYEPDEVITATLFYSDQLTVKRQVSQDDNGDPSWIWLDFNGEIAAGDWLSVTNGSDWNAWLQAPQLTLEADRATDLISGDAPETLLHIESGNDQYSFGVWVPSYADSAGQRFILDTSAFGVDLDFGAWTTVYYQAPDGNRARRSFGYPDLYARYNPDGSSSVFGSNVTPDSTITITITSPISGVVASGITWAGTGWMGPTGYNLDFPSYGFSPGDVVQVDYGSGLTNTLTVVELTAQMDVDQDRVTGLGPAYGWLNAWIHDSQGNSTNIDQVQVSPSGAYIMDFGAIGWDINNGDNMSVYYNAGRGGVVERNTYLPRPELNFSPWNTNGSARPGGPYAYGMWLSNDGDLAAQDVQVVLNLPPDTAWAGDTTGVAPQIGANGVITFNLGTLAAYEQRNYFITLQLDPAHPTGDGALGPLCGSASTSTSGDSDPGNDSSCSGSANVVDEDIDIRVDKWPNPGDVVAGQEFDYQVQYCNDRSSAAGPVWLTDTLPVSTTFISLEPRNWWGEKFWSEVTVADGVLQAYFPSIPGNNCTDLILRLRADASLPLNTVLSNRVELYTAGDVYTDNNVRINEDARISIPRPDLNLGKYLDGANLTPGGELYYKLDTYNAGNIVLSGRLTDTLPAGTAYVERSAYDYDGQPVDPILVTAGEVVWDVGEIGVNQGFGLTYRASIDESVTPGTTLLNCATIGHTAGEVSPDNNTACDERTVNEHGPNLHLSAQYWWNGDSQLGFQIDFANWGDAMVSSFWITDILPANTQWDGWRDMGWDWNRLVSEDHSASQLRWEFRDIYPGDSGWLQFNANLDDPNARPRTYTNLASISLYPDDSDPADNSAETSVTLGEVERVEFWVGTDNSDGWGEAQPDTTVTFLNRGVTYTTYADPGCGGCWNIGDIGPVWPGDTFTVTAGAGVLPVVIHVPDPFSVQADSSTDQVWGQLGVDPGSWLRVELDGYSGIDAQVNASGSYTATFPDIPRGGQGYIRYETTIDYAQAVFHRRYQTPDLIMGANIAHDWVQGNYEVGHTVWITVTESDGVTEKAHAQVLTYNIPWWGGRPGFEPQSEDWIPEQPDLQEGDWVYGLLDGIYTSTIHLGAITGNVDADNDRITGTVLADWISQPVSVWCHTWGAPDNNTPGKGDTILPDGVDEYACAWDPLSEWDVQPGQDIGVQYTEPDGDSVYNVFHAPSPNLRVEIGPNGNPGEGGNLQWQLQYANQGEITSENVVITHTLQGMQYLSDNSGFSTITGTTPGGDPYVVYQLGSLPPGDWMQFDVFAQITAPASQTITSTVKIFGTPDGGDPGDKERSWSGHVAPNDTHLNLGKGAWTGDPTPGGQFIWAVNACSNSSTSSSAVYITDTLPAHMTLLDWWGQHDGWSEISEDASQLVVMRPTLPNGWCSEVYLRFLVDAGAPVGTNISNTARVWAANDIELDDNYTENWVSINNPHTNLYTGMWWGQGSLVPGGIFRYHMDVGNNGNVPVSAFWMTDTLPVSTTVDHINIYDRNWTFIESISPIYLPGNRVTWQMGSLENGDSYRIEVSLRADEDALPGTTLVNTAEVEHQPGEDSYDDNTASWTETLYDHGPNLRLTAQWGWNGDSQLWYQIDFANVGDQMVSSFNITDVLPANTQWDGWWNWGWDWSRLVSTDLTSDQLNWQLMDIYPADGGWIQFHANLDDPNARPRWYTNTATITLDPADSNPADNTAVTSVVMGEVERVEMWVSPGSSGVWGEAMPGVTVTVTTPSEVLTAWADPGCGGCWGVGTSSALQPGDLVVVTAGAGLLPVRIQVPDPFTVQADSTTDTVWGQIDNLDHQYLDVWLYGLGGSLRPQTDANGNFTVTFPDIPQATNGEVRYETMVDYARVYYSYRFQADDLLLNINVGHDWLQAVYPAGHTVWITLTNSLGVEKATYNEVTRWSGAWDGRDGFETQGHLWSPSQPNIEAGDWVYARSDDGRTAQVQIGAITGELDLLGDSISGIITAPFATPLAVQCQVWVENGPAGIDTTVDPAGGSYTCSWAGVFDLQPNMSVAVMYFEPDRQHRIIEVFQVYPPQLYINKWIDGQPGEGGNTVFHIDYQNQGGGPAEDVLITDTLPVGLSYLSDTAPFPLISIDPLVWDLGSLPGGSNATFEVFAHVDAPAGTPLTNTAHIATSTPWDTAPPENKVSVWTGSVQPSDLQVNIGIWPLVGNPVPGYQFLYEISPCNGGSTASAEVTLTETLPISLTLVDWWNQSSGWTEYSRSDHELVLKRATLQEYQCHNVQVLVEVGASVPVGTQLTNTARIFAQGDTYTDDNVSTTWVTTDNPGTNLSISKTWNRGSLTPGGLLYYDLNFSVGGNVRPQGLLITDTLPASTTLYEAYLPGEVTQVGGGPGYVVWQVDVVDAYWGSGFQVALQVDPAATPGTVLTNTVQIGALGPYPQESNPDDNTARVVRTLNPSGPNLKVSKTHYLYDPTWARYNITFENPGSETIYDVWITDTLPASMTFNGYMQFNFDEPRLQSFDALGGSLRWHLSYLNPGEIGSMDIDVNPNDPNLRPAWYNNTVEISLPPGDTNPADNTYLDEWVLGEVTHVNLLVGVNNAWINGNVLPNTSVSVQTASGVFTTQGNEWDGGWSFGDIGAVQPGDTVTVTAGAETLPVVIHVPDPFSAEIDSNLDQVWGQIGGAAGQPIEVAGGWFDGYRYLNAGADGAFTANYGDIPVGAGGEVRYAQTIDYAAVTFVHPFDEAYVNLGVHKYGYSTPAPGGNYTYQINYRNESGEIASNVILTDTLPVGATYLSDNSGYPASVIGSQVVWQLGDLGNIDTGFQMVVAVDPGLVPGTELVNNIEIATASFEWEYGDNSFEWGVTVSSNDTHLSVGVGPSLGDPAPGSQYWYGFSVCNNGSTASSGVLLTTTLPVTVTYLGLSPGSWSEVSVNGQQIVLSYPSVGAWECPGSNLNVQLAADAAIGSLLDVTTIITASNDMESYDNTNFYQHSVGAPRIDQWVNKYFNGGVLVPGSTLQFQVQYGYDANFAPGTLTITDTLPVSTTFVDAWWYGPSGQEYLTPASSGDGYVVFELNGLTANNYGSEFYLRVQIDDAAIPGTELVNTAQVRAHPAEGYFDNNTSSWSETLLAHNSDLNINIGGGWDLSNNLANLGVGINNQGDLDAGPFIITATYPVSMSLAGDVWGDGRMTGWLDYPDQHYITATFSHLEAQQGASIYFNTQMTGGGPILGGQLFTFDTQATLLPDDINPDNNHFSVTLASGPDLYVEKNLSYGSLYPGGSLTYNLHVGNRSTAQSWPFQGSGRITDTLPAGLTYTGSSWTPILVDGQTIVWDLGYVWPGWETWIDVNAVITNTAIAGELFTNTAVIASTSAADVDLNPLDNTSSYAFVLREVTQVDLQVGVEHPWINGYTIPNSTVNVQTASNTYTTTANSWDGGWQVDDIGLVQPGAAITVTAGAGTLPVVIHVPDPFSAEVDSDLEQVWGAIGSAEALTIEVHSNWGEGVQYVVGGSGGAYTAAFVDVPPGASGEVLFRQTIDYAAVTFHRPYHEPYVNLAVDKYNTSTPAPGGNFTYQVNYQNQSGDPASNVLITDTLPAGLTYVSDTSGFPVSVVGSQVVWQLGDLVPTYSGFQLVVAVDPGLTPGTELVNTVQIATSTDEWEYSDNFYQHSSTVAANDTHLSIGVQSYPHDPIPGSQYWYGFNVCNNGNTASSGVLLTATLPVSTTYTGLTDSWWQQESASGQQVVLSHPSIPGWNCFGGNLHVQLDPGAPIDMLLEASAVITASNDMESYDNTSLYQHVVGAPRINQWVSKYHNSGLLVPGSVLQFQISYSYDANFAPGTVTITDTLPASTTFVDAWRNVPEQEYITPAASGDGYVVFELTDQTANGYSDSIYIRVQVDSAAIPGTELVNTAQIRAHPIETYLDDNQSSWSGTLGAHNADLFVGTGGGWDLPNNLANLWFYINNQGDLSPGPFTITVTYPLSMSLVGPISGDGWLTNWQDYPDQHYFTATYSDLDPQNSAWVYYSAQMVGGGPIPSGKIFDFIHDVSVPPEDPDSGNNHAVTTLTSGPDLFVEKSISWVDPVPGGTVMYYLHLGNRSNTSSWNPQETVRITDTLPAGLTFYTSNWGPVLEDGQTIVWEAGIPYPGWDAWLEVYATITDTARGGDVFTNTATIASNGTADIDVNPADNTSSVAFEIPGAAFDIGKRVEGSLQAGTLVTYTLSVTNTGNVTGTNLSIYDPLPADLTYSASDGTWDGAGVSWGVAQLAPDESAQMWFSAMLPSTAGGTITNQDYQVTGSDQGVVSPLGAPLSFTVRAPDLVASFAQSHSTIGVGGSVTFTDTSTTDGFPIVGWWWDLGDGSSQTGAQPFSHTYTTAGDFTVTLLITDTLGFTGTATSLVQVTSQHFTGCASNTDNNASVVVPLDVSITDDLVLEAGDEIAIYNSANNLCAGASYWTGSGNVGITAWGDDITVTPDVVDGLLVGEMMLYRIWDASEELEYSYVTATYIFGDGIYQVNSMHVVGALDLNVPEVQTIDLIRGWNMISTYIDPSDPSIVDVFSQIVSDVVLVKNGRGQIYWPAYGVNQIINWNVLDGYQVYMTAAMTLTITGTQVAPESTPISLNGGWSLVSYLRDTPMPIGTALSSLGSSLYLAKDGAGRIYWPTWGVNQIINMLPGQGYQLYLTEPATLTYPANSALAPIELETISTPALEHFNGCASATGSNGTALLPSDLLAGLELQAGDELAVFGARSGLCAGALSWQGVANQALTAWGDDEITDAVDGLQNGEAMTWKVWRRSTGREIIVRFAYRKEGPFQSDGLYTENGLYGLEAAPSYQLFLPVLRR